MLKSERCEVFFFVLKSITTHKLKVNTIKRIYPQQIYNNFLKIQFFLLNNFVYEVHSNMSLRDKIDNDYKNALKSKDKNKISTYRLILSGVKDLDISNRSGPNKKETDDEDIKKLLKKMIKQRSEAIEIYKKNNRSDLLEIEQGELDVLSEYLPKQLSEADTQKICVEIIKSSGASSIKDMGKVMGELKKNHADTIDFSKAGQIIKNLLNSR